MSSPSEPSGMPIGSGGSSPGATMPGAVHVVIGNGSSELAARLVAPGGRVVHLGGDPGDGRRLLEIAAGEAPVVYWPWPGAAGGSGS